MEKIAYLGLGIMGQGMVGNLLKAGYPVTVWNRTSERCAPFVARGAKQAGTPAQAVRETIKGAVNRGWGELNASAFIRNLEEQASVQVKKKQLRGEN